MQRRRVQIRIFVLQRLTRRQGRTRKGPLFKGQMRVSRKRIIAINILSILILAQFGRY
jgi:hypothetical protein